MNVECSVVEKERERDLSTSERHFVRLCFAWRSVVGSSSSRARNRDGRANFFEEVLNKTSTLITENAQNS